VDFINELVYLAHIAQTNKSARDKRQRNKYYQSTLLENENEDENKNELLASEKPAEPIEQKERRSEGDRRQSKLPRGRYVESRQQISRRNNPDIDMKI